MRLSDFSVLLMLASVTVYMRAQDRLMSFTDFSATQVFIAPNLEASKIYSSGATVRVEGAAMATLYQHSAGKVYTISSYPDGASSCVVMDSDKVMMSLPSPLEQLVRGPIIQRTPSGAELVEGKNAKIEKISVRDTDGKIIEGKVWFAEDVKGVPVKIESQLPDGEKFIAIYRDVKIGTPEKALLMPPQKCTPYNKMWQVGEHKTFR